MKSSLLTSLFGDSPNSSKSGAFNHMFTQYVIKPQYQQYNDRSTMSNTLHYYGAEMDFYVYVKV